MSMHVPNRYRARAGRLGTSDAAGNNGAFFIPNKCRPLEKGAQAVPLSCIASDGEGWEHVSVSLPYRTPTWAEMDYVKRLFWDDEDCVMQLHAPRGTWVNNHPHCLHLWRPLEAAIPTPPGALVGVHGLTPEQTRALVQSRMEVAASSLL